MSDHSSVISVKKPSNSLVILRNTSIFTLEPTSSSVRNVIWSSVELMHFVNTNWDTKWETCPVDTVGRTFCTLEHYGHIELCIMVRLKMYKKL